LQEISWLAKIFSFFQEAMENNRLTLQNGTVVEWYSENCFEKPNIRVVSSSSQRCGNPWNQMSSDEEHKYVLSTMPLTCQKPKSMHGFLQTKFLDAEQVKLQMQDLIYCDFNCLHETDQNRSFVHTIYDSDEHEDEIRVNLHDHCNRILIEQYLNAGNILIFIMGVGGKFRDIYFQRNIDDSYIMNEFMYLLK
jgi:hypothetical protein